LKDPKKRTRERGKREGEILGISESECEPGLEAGERQKVEGAGLRRNRGNVEETLSFGREGNETIK